MSGPLPENLLDLESLEVEVARRMSITNAQANRVFQDYQYCMRNKNMRKALELQRAYLQKKERVKILGARLQQVQQKRDELTNPPPLQLPPPVLTIRVNPIVGRGPSFRKEFMTAPSPIQRA